MHPWPYASWDQQNRTWSFLLPYGIRCGQQCLKAWLVDCLIQCDGAVLLALHFDLLLARLLLATTRSLLFVRRCNWRFCFVSRKLGCISPKSHLNPTQTFVDSIVQSKGVCVKYRLPSSFLQIIILFNCITHHYTSLHSTYYMFLSVY